ncbi:MAG: hypothetical protein EBU84_01555 [Actinobacteria bacterium]|nr:hypothetical protein [Actinomycetota bacterium]
MPENLPRSRAEAAEQLLAAADGVIPLWLERCVRKILLEQRIESGEADAKISLMVRQASPMVMGELGASVTGTLVLSELGAKEVHRDDFSRQSFPNDIFGLSPATWIDVDESLHDPGLIWGAWTAREALDREL